METQVLLVHLCVLLAVDEVLRITAVTLLHLLTVVAVEVETVLRPSLTPVV
jgi:hypothetical protein